MVRVRRAPSNAEGMLGPHRCGTLRLEPPRKNRNITVQRRLQSFMKITEQDGHLHVAGSGSGH